jgi:succinate dehydrogenase / fumarate reductase cytochrome b subunit
MSGSRIVALGRSTVGKKAISAASGLVLCGYVLVHMLANLQIFAGHARIDAYARGLRASPLLLWSVRAVLAVAFVVHVVVALQLAARRHAARPISYLGRAPRGPGWMARGMLVSGVVLALFVVVHLANLTWGFLHPHFVHLAVYDNVVALFRVAHWSVLYVVAVAALALHAAHGAWSAPQSLGLTPERGVPRLRPVARAAAIAVAAGFLAVIVAVVSGGLR